MSAPTRTRKRRPAAGAAGCDSQAQRIAADRLQRAARWLLAFHPIGQEHRPYADRGAFAAGLVIRFDPPGVLRVFDAIDGELLAESAPGQPDVLAAGFVATARTL